MRLRCVTGILTLLLAGPLTAGPPDTKLEIVEGLMAAFNRHDVDAMTAYLTDDVQWLSVNGATISVEADGKQAVRDGMKGYFASLPSARSSLEGSFVSGRYVTVRERASWKQEGEDRSQSALAVYEIVDDRIRRVWYYPAEE